MNEKTQVQSDLMASLSQLDPKNSEHWTDAGLPAVEAVKDIYGSAVTRAQLEAVAPGFTKTNPVLSDPNEMPGGENTPSPDTGEETAEKREERKAKIQKDLDIARKEMAAAKAKLDAANFEMDAIVSAETHEMKQKSFADTVSAYQKASSAQRAENQANLRTMAELMKGSGLPEPAALQK